MLPIKVTGLSKKIFRFVRISIFFTLIIFLSLYLQICFFFFFDLIFYFFLIDFWDDLSQIPKSPFSVKLNAEILVIILGRGIVYLLRPIFKERIMRF